MNNKPWLNQIFLLIFMRCFVYKLKLELFIVSIGTLFFFNCYFDGYFKIQICPHINQMLGQKETCVLVVQCWLNFDRVISICSFSKKIQTYRFLDASLFSNESLLILRPSHANKSIMRTSSKILPLSLSSYKTSTFPSKRGLIPYQNLGF